MKERHRARASRPLERFAKHLTSWTGSTAAFSIAFGIIIVWGLTGRLFEFSDTWQLVINTGTTIVTFLMVFLIQRSQNKDSLAIHLKLNELIAAMDGASNRMVNAEDLSEGSLRALHRHYAHLARLSKQNGSIFASHSVEEATERHAHKNNAQAQLRALRAARHQGAGGGSARG